MREGFILNVKFNAWTHTHTHTCTIWKLCLFLLVFRRCDNNVPTHPGIEHRRFHLFCLCVLLLSKCRSKSQLSSVFWNQLTWILEIVLCSPLERNGIEWNQGEESWLYIWGKLFEFLVIWLFFHLAYAKGDIWKPTYFPFPVLRKAIYVPHLKR